MIRALVDERNVAISSRAWSIRSCPRQCHVRISRVVAVLASSALLVSVVGAPSAIAEEVDGASATPVAARVTPAVQPLAPPVIQGTPAEILQEIPVTEPLTVGYRGGLFLSPAELKKKDKRGCNYRNQMLIKLATKKPKVGAGCRLSGGEWQIDFGLKTVKKASQVKLGKLFPDKFVYGQGAYGWTPEQRRAYALSSTTVGKATRAASRGLLNENLVQPLSASGLIAVNKFGAALINTDSAAKTEAELDLLKKVHPGLYESWTVTTLLNAKSWGISFSLGLHTTSFKTIKECSDSDSLRYGNEIIKMRSPDFSKSMSDSRMITNLCSNTYSVVNQAQLIGIQVVPAFASAVPPTNETVLTSYGTPQGPAIDRHLFGIHAPADWVSDAASGFDGPIKEATIPNVPVGYLRLWDTETTWADLEPSNGNYVWRKLDKQIEMAQILDADVMMVLGGTPAWAGDGSPQSNPKNLDDWREYVFNVCKRYGAGIRSFEVWNEANLQTFWKGTAVEMADLTKAAFEEIRRCGSGALVVAANTTSRATGSFGNFYPAYLQALKERNWPVDAYSVHSYPTASGGADDRIKGIGQFRTMLALAGAPQTTVFDSEINYGLAGLTQEKVDLTGQNAMTLISRTYIDSARYGFGSTFWFVWTANPDSKFGIQFTRNSSAERQAWNTTYDWLVGAQFQRCYETEISVIVCQFNKGASNFSIVWRGDIGSPVQETPVGYFSGLGSQVCDLFGQCTSVTQSSTTTVGPMPRRIDGPPSGTGPASAPSTPSSAVAPQPPVIIGKPTVTYTTANTQTLNVTWGPAVITDGSAVIQETGYEYQVAFCGKSESACAGKQPDRTGVAPAGLQSVGVRVTEGPGVYRFRVRALNGSAESAWTETPILVRSTRALPPEYVRASFDTESNTVRVSWDTPRVALSKIDYYEIELNAINPSRPWGSVKFTSKSPSFSKTLEELGLSPTTTVQFRVRTVLTSGLKSIFETSNELTFRDDLPAPGASAAVIDVTPNKAIVLPESDQRISAAAWQIRVSSDGGASWQIVPCGAADVAEFYSFTCADGFTTNANSAILEFEKMGITADFNTLVQIRYVNANRTSASNWGLISLTTVAPSPVGLPVSSFPANARPKTVTSVTRINGVIASYGGTNAG